MFDMGDGLVAVGVGNTKNISDEDMKSASTFIKETVDKMKEQFKDNPDVMRAVASGIPFYYAQNMVDNREKIDDVLGFLGQIRIQDELFNLQNLDKFNEQLLDDKNSDIAKKFLKFMLEKGKNG